MKSKLTHSVGGCFFFIFIFFTKISKIKKLTVPLTVWYLLGIICYLYGTYKVLDFTYCVFKYLTVPTCYLHGTCWVFIRYLHGKLMCLLIVGNYVLLLWFLIMCVLLYLLTRLYTKRLYTESTSSNWMYVVNSRVSWWLPCERRESVRRKYLLSTLIYAVNLCVIYATYHM